MTNHERVGKALELLKAGLGPFVDREMQRAVKAQRVGAAALRPFVDDPNVGDRRVSEWDAAALLKLMRGTWNDVFRAILGRAAIGFIHELLDQRNRWAHQEPFSVDDAYRALDTAGRLLAAVSAPQAVEVDRLKMELLRVRFDEQVRGERRGHADRSEEGTSHPVTSTTDNERPNVWVVRADRGLAALRPPPSATAIDRPPAVSIPAPATDADPGDVSPVEGEPRAASQDGPKIEDVGNVGKASHRKSNTAIGYPKTSTTDNERPAAVWVVRANGGSYTEHFVANGYAGIGTVDVSSAKDRDEIRRLCEQAHPDWNAGRIGNYTGQYYDFLFRIREGDYVLTPELDAGRLRYGRVIGPGESAAGDDGCPYRNRRAVDWHPASFSRVRLSKSLRKTLQRPPTIFPVSQREEFLDAVGLSDAAPRGAEGRNTLLQFLPGAWWTTRQGAARGLYPEFPPPAASPASPPPAPAPPAGGWSRAVELAAPEVHALLGALSVRGAPEPEVGFELAGAGGAVAAEAELGWPAHEVAVLLPGREADAAAFAAAGWRVLAADADNLAEALADVFANGAVRTEIEETAEAR